MKLNQLRDKAFDNAKAHGWHEEEHSDRHFLMLIITELAEAVQADRIDKFANRMMFEKANSDTQFDTQEHWIFSFESFIKDSIQDELADACIRILDLAGLRNIDMSDRFIISYTVSKKKTFPENIYAIIKDIVNYKYTLEENLNYSIRNIFELARFYDIDLEWHIGMKMNYNNLREYKHGNKKY